MKPRPTPGSDEPPMDPVPETDILISRIVDAEATDEERARFESLAGGNPELWRDLADGYRHDAALRDAVAIDIELADAVEVDAEPGSRGALVARGPRPLVRILNTAAMLSGWAAAIALAVIWGLGGLGPSATTPVIKALDPTYRDHVVEQNPLEGWDPVLLQLRSLPDGRTEMIIMHRPLERIILDEKVDAASLIRDEALDRTGGVAREGDGLN